ncbi:MAG: GAF domain-containing protein [Chloroflexota bacterium]
MPVNLGGVTLGVIAAGHREGGKSFSRRDERLLTAIADFTAIAIQNARVYRPPTRH